MAIGDSKVEVLMVRGYDYDNNDDDEDNNNDDNNGDDDEKY